MPSADFCPPFRSRYRGRSTWQADRPPRVMRSHLRAYARRIYVRAFRASIGLRIYLPASPRPAASYAVSVRRASVLPAASFRFHLAVDTLAVRLAVPLAGSAEDFHLQVSAPCRAHKKEALPERSASLKTERRENGPFRQPTDSSALPHIRTRRLARCRRR